MDSVHVVWLSLSAATLKTDDLPFNDYVDSNHSVSDDICAFLYDRNQG